MPAIPKKSYLNGGMGTVLPPDENTQEMAVDCPASYIAAHPPMSGSLTPRSAAAPPPTPLDGSVVGSQSYGSTSKDLEAVAAVAAGLPQPDMNFQRIHRMRESVKRQKEQRERDQRIRQQMADDEGSKKIERLKHMSPEEERSKRKGIENVGFETDSYLSEDNQYQSSRATPDVQKMFSSINSISQQIDAEEISDDVIFLKQLLQSSNFQEALHLHNTLVETTLPSSDDQPLCPETSHLKSLALEVEQELMFCHLDEANELNKILNVTVLQELMSAHDGIAALLEPTDQPFVDVVNVNSAEDDEIIQRVSRYTDKEVRIVRLEKTSEALGATVRSEEDGRVTIGRIVSGGAAEKSGLLREGDELVEVNARSMRGLDVNEVGDAISAMNGALVFVVASASPRGNGSAPHADVTSVVKHVRALFDYDAFDDPYLPCRELGLSFQKGDVLRIMSTDDRDWWQAYRDADDDTHLTLAGLVPSQQFQHQRESLRISLTKESESPENNPSLFCGRRKKSPKKFSPNTTAAADETVDTYEDMALYQQPEDKKRPIVLIGPPNVGRPELRQRLIDNDQDRFAIPVPHTTRPSKEDEVQDVHYDFVTSDRFERMVEAREFLEHGSYQKDFYGTTIAAVQVVMRSGKICVLNLHAESLPGLSVSGLMPYIVFIAPPPLEKLRANMQREGKQLKEEELRAIIENARDMERRYAHFFDETIRNTDLNRSYAELLRLINKLDTQPQWVPAAWLD